MFLFLCTIPTKMFASCSYSKKPTKLSWVVTMEACFTSMTSVCVYAKNQKIIFIIRWKDIASFIKIPYIPLLWNARSCDWTSTAWSLICCDWTLVAGRDYITWREYDVYVRDSNSSGCGRLWSKTLWRISKVLNLRSSTSSMTYSFAWLFLAGHLSYITTWSAARRWCSWFWLRPTTWAVL